MVYNNTMTIKTEYTHVTAKTIEYEWHDDVYTIGPDEALVFNVTYAGETLSDYWDEAMKDENHKPFLGESAEVVVQKIIHHWTDDLDVPDEFELYGTFLQGDVYNDADTLKANYDTDTYERIELGPDFDLLVADYYGLIRN